MNSFDYSTAFSRNRGYFTEEEQLTLKDAHVAVAGLGGTGGVQTHALARLGIGNFTLADLDHYDLKNFNRQIGATISTVGKKKTEVISEMILDINPEANVTTVNEGIQPETIDAFLENADLVIDALDFYCFEQRMLLYKKAREKNIWVINVAPPGYGATMLLFDPQGMSFEDYFDIKKGMSSDDLTLHQMVGLNPKPFMFKYLDVKAMNAKNNRLPCVVPAFFLVAGMASTEVVKILLRKGKVHSVPYVSQFDAFLGAYRRKYYQGGMKHPLRRLNRWFIKKALSKGSKSCSIDVPEINIAQKKSLSNKQRILFMAEGVTLAHVARPLELAKSLDPEKYEVFFACNKRYDKMLADTPFTKIPLNSISQEEFEEKLKGLAPVYDKQTLSRYVREDIDIIKQVAPNLIVGDFRLSLGVSAELCKVPYATISNVHWSPFATHKMIVPDSPITKIFGLRLGQWLFNFINPIVSKHHSKPINELRQDYGLKPLEARAQVVYNHADITLYADVAGLTPTKKLPSSHHYLGPIAWSPEVKDFEEIKKQIPEDKPVVYVTLGSSGEASVLPKVVEALGKLPITALVATAGKVKLEKVPKNVLARDFLPGEECAKLAKIVISNGGCPTTYQALKQGAPVLAIPCNMDQLLNMQGIKRFGCGLVLRPSQVNEKTLHEKITLLMTSSHAHKQASKIAATISHHKPAEIFESILQGILQETLQRTLR